MIRQHIYTRALLVLCSSGPVFQRVGRGWCGGGDTPDKPDSSSGYTESTLSDVFPIKHSWILALHSFRARPWTGMVWMEVVMHQTYQILALGTQSQTFRFCIKQNAGTPQRTWVLGAFTKFTRFLLWVHVHRA